MRLALITALLPQYEEIIKEKTTIGQEVIRTFTESKISSICCSIAILARDIKDPTGGRHLFIRKNKVVLHEGIFFRIPTSLKRGSTDCVTPLTIITNHSCSFFITCNTSQDDTVVFLVDAFP